MSVATTIALVALALCCSVGTWTAHARIEETGSALRIEVYRRPQMRVITDGFAPLQRGVVLDLYARDDNSDVGGYDQLTTSNGSDSVDVTCEVTACLSGPNETCDMAWYLTAAGLMDNKIILAQSVCDIDYRFWWTKLGKSNPGSTRLIHFDFYHYDASTGLAGSPFSEESKLMLTAETDQSGTYTVDNDQAFDVNDRLAMKLWAEFECTYGPE